ncbi:MAG: hypothetical protein QOD99_1414 [Chthoniobacter sp.]|nr:hypothetical protein [Chthoniobacter sp.]
MKIQKFSIALFLLLAWSLPAFAVPPADILYVGDNSNNTVRRFNAVTGAAITGGDSAGVFVSSRSGGLSGPRAMVTLLKKLFVVNQRVNTSFNGEVESYRLNNGAFTSTIVSTDNPDPVFAPRGMVYWHSQHRRSSSAPRGNYSSRSPATTAAPPAKSAATTWGQRRSTPSCPSAAQASLGISPLAKPIPARWLTTPDSTFVLTKLSSR